MPQIITPRILPRAAATFALGVGLTLAAMTMAQAQPQPDPMQALRGRAAGSIPLDPMSALTAPVAQAEVTTADAGDPELGGLPQGPGAEETYYQCVACHSTQIIMQQRITDLRWDELWIWMVESQGMVPPDDDTKQLILAYLKQNFSSQR